VVDFLNFIPPPHLVRFASLIGLGTPPVRRGNFGELFSVYQKLNKPEDPSKFPLLSRRGGLWLGAEGDETEAGVVDCFNLIPPPHLVRFASLIGLGTPPVRRGNFGELFSVYPKLNKPVDPSKFPLRTGGESLMRKPAF
jgi:hypothetical protein